MVTLLVFAVALLVAAVISERAHRTILSTSVVFLVVGFVVAPGRLDLISVEAGDAAVELLVEVALFAVLFTDGMKPRIARLRAYWQLPVRALGIGLPLTLILVAVLAAILVGLPWPQALLVGAVLSPTDPVFAKSLIGAQRVPQRLRSLLNVESGINDGIALPIVLFMIGVVGGNPSDPVADLGNIALGIGIGVVVPIVAVRLEKAELLGTHPDLERLLVLAIGLIIFSLSSLLHANEFLAAFAGGFTTAVVAPRLADDFEETGELIAELLKLGGLLVFGALLSTEVLVGFGLAELIFAALALLLARPVALGIALIGTSLRRRERLAAAWFGPRGFASVLYAIFVLESGIPGAEQMFHVAALVIAGSIILHTSTDTLVARTFRDWPDEPEDGAELASSDPRRLARSGQGSPGP